MCAQAWRGALPGSVTGSDYPLWPFMGVYIPNEIVSDALHLPWLRMCTNLLFADLLTLLLCCADMTMQDGADERDRVQEEVCSMLLEYADELEQEERELAKRQKAWEAETARLAAEQAAFEVEQAKIAAQQAEARRIAEEAAK